MNSILSPIVIIFVKLTIRRAIKNEDALRVLLSSSCKRSLFFTLSFITIKVNRNIIAIDAYYNTFANCEKMWYKW